jgi:hypothetical protein
MILEVFTVYDSAVKAYLPPFYGRSKGEAIRSFTEAVNDRGHQFNKYPADYSLWHLGKFDDSNAAFKVDVSHRVVGGHEVLVPDEPFASPVSTNSALPAPGVPPR